MDLVGLWERLIDPCKELEWASMGTPSRIEVVCRSAL